jgi:hypothetical protein
MMATKFSKFGVDATPHRQTLTIIAPLARHLSKRMKLRIKHKNLDNTIEF